MRDLWHPLVGRRGARFGLVFIGLVLMVAMTADFLASDRPLVARFKGELYLLPNLLDPPSLHPYTIESMIDAMQPDDWMIPPPVPWGVNQQDIGQHPLAPPSTDHWLGTDTARRDVLCRLVHGARVSTLVGLLSVAIYVSLGTVLGLLAGYFGGFTDAVISRLTESVMSIPVFFLILAVMGVLEQAGVGAIVIVIGLVHWTSVARLVRAEALRLRSLEFIEAAIAQGYSSPRIIIRHVLPNAVGPILVSTTFGVASAILIEAALSFLGFGAPDTTASWGGLLHGAMGNFHAWWLVLFPGLCIFATVIAYNLVGEALRDAIDPRLRHG